MNKIEIYGIIRAILAAIAGFVAGQGYVDSETATTVAGAITTIVVAVWSVKAKRAAPTE